MTNGGEEAERLARIEARRERLNVEGVHADPAERRRVRDILRRDREEEKAEERRRSAELEVAEGRFVNLQDTKVEATPERMAKAVASDLVQTVEMKEKIDGTVRKVATVRVGATRLLQLYRRGVLDDDLFAACKWYRDKYDIAGWERIRVASYGQRMQRDHIPPVIGTPEFIQEAKADFEWARTYIPDDVRFMFELVALAEYTISDAAKTAKCRYKNGIAAFRRGALCLYDGVKSRLKIGEW